MNTSVQERQLVRRAQSNLEQWANSARSEAFNELFEGEDQIVTADEVGLLDRLDSALERHGGDGLWGTDQYGILTADNADQETALRIVCVYHPRITEDSVLRGGDDVDDATEERLNAALWRYSERVATLIERRLDEFLREAQQ